MISLLNCYHTAQNLVVKYCRAWAWPMMMFK